MDFHKKIHSDRHRPTPVFIIACFFSTVKLFCGISGKWGGVFGKKAKKNEPQATKKFFDPAIFQKCWRGSGRVALIAARRQRNPCAMLLAHGGGGEKSDSFSRRANKTAPPCFPEAVSSNFATVPGEQLQWISDCFM